MLTRKRDRKHVVRTNNKAIQRLELMKELRTGAYECRMERQSERFQVISKQCQVPGGATIKARTGSCLSEVEHMEQLSKRGRVTNRLAVTRPGSSMG